MNQDLQQPVLPWWRVPIVWLVVGGPALVVVASFVTLFLAVRGGDTPLRVPADVQADTMTPAKQARNHATTAPR
jgi:hypothetical protein